MRNTTPQEVKQVFHALSILLITAVIFTLVTLIFPTVGELLTATPSEIREILATLK